MKHSLLSAFLCVLLAGSAAAQISLSFSSVPPTCNGFTNGSASVSPSGGSAPYSFTWQNGQTGDELIGIGAGTYQVTVTDAQNNTAVGAATVAQPEPVVAGIAATDLACNGQSGTLTALSSGGVGAFTYSWSTSETGSSINVTAPGNYFVTISDANQCSDVADLQVPAALQVSLDVTQVRCTTDPNSGALHVNVTGGTAPYTYLWNDGNTQPVRQNLPPGNYIVVVTAANGCTAMASATLVMPPPLQATLIATSPACGGANNGSATILATGGTPPYTHTWTPGGFTGSTVTGLAPGQYYVCTFDANQCQVDLWVMIPEITNLAVDLTIQSAECPGVNDGVATALVNPPGNYQYQWNLPPFTGVTQITGLAANTLVAVTVTDPVSGCTGADSAIVSAHNQMSVIVTDTDIPCAGQNIGTAVATASGGTPQYNYVWTVPPTNDTIGFGANIDGLAAGAYVVSVTDSRGCTAIGVADIDVLSAPDAQIGGFTTITCGEDSTLVEFVNLSTDPLGTITSWTWTLTGTDGIPSVYNNVSPLQVYLPVGDTVTATLTVTSAAGCLDTAVQQLIVPGIPAITLSTGPTVFICQNTPVYIEVFGGQPYYTYTWSPLTGLTLDSIPPNATAHPDTTTTYQLIANNQGCADTVQVQIILGNQIELTVDQNEIHTCDSTAVLQAFSNVPNVIWVDAAGNPVGNPPGNPVTVAVDSAAVYTAIATDANGCADSVQVTVFGHTINVEIDPAFPGMGCSDTDIPLGLINHNPTDVLEYVWTVTAPLTINNPNSANPTVSGPVGNYIVTVTVTNQYDCSETLEIPVKIEELIEVTQLITADLCNGLQVQFTNASGLSGTWDFGDGATSNENSPLHIYGAAGQYHVVFTPELMVCTMPWDSLIQVLDTSIAAPGITHNYVVCVNQADIQFNGTSNLSNVNWAWTFENGTPPVSTEQNPLVTFQEEGVITAQLITTDVNGCADSTQVEVDIFFIEDEVPATISYCSDTTIVYLNANGIDSTATYFWTANPADPGLNPTDPNPGVSPLTQTVYTVTITQGTNCSVVYTVTVTPEPSPDIDLDPDFPAMGCAFTEIPLGVINNTPGQTLIYQWTALPPLTLTGANSANPTVSGPAGNYVVTVTVTNLANCTDMLEVPVMIDEGQSIQQSITADLCDGTNVQFFNNSGLSGTWNFGDNSTSVEQNPVHQYSAGGQYLVTFTPLNAVCTAPWDSLITVFDNTLEPPVIANNYVVCINQAEIQFNGTSNIPGVSWSWTFEGGTPLVSASQNPLVEFNQEGPVTASVTVTDANGCVDSSEEVVDVIFVNDEVPATLEFCNDTTVVFLNPNGFDPGAGYVWTSNPADPNLDATNPNPGVSPSVPTVYTVTISQGAFCSVTYEVTVTPLAGPDVDLDPEFPGMGCANTPIQLGLINNNPGDPLSYSWTATPPLVLTGGDTANPTVSGPAGSYVVTVTITNLTTNCTETLEVPVQIDAEQSIQQSITADLCDGTNVQFFNNSGLSGTWNFGDNSTSVEQNPVHQYSAGGQYLVTFTPLNAVCTAPWDSLITVFDNALEPPVIANNYVVCINQAEIQFNGTSNIPGVSWSWTFEGGTPLVSASQNPLVVFNQEGPITASVTVTDANGCVDSSEAVVDVIFVDDEIPATLEFCNDTTVVFLNPNGFDPGAGYVWTSNPADPNLDATNPNPGVSPSVPTVYTVTISQGAFCSVTYEVAVTPLAGPDVDLDPEFPGMGCANTPIQLGLINNNPGDPLSYSWTATPPLVLTGGNTANPTVSGPAGSYVVTVTITNLTTNCTETLEVPVQIDAEQSIQQSITADLCDGTNVQFLNNSGLSGTWNFGDNSTSVEQNPVHQYSAGGQYLVTFTPLNAVCTAPWDSLITVFDNALEPPVIANNYVVCINQAEIQFNGTSNIPGVSWSWTFEGGTPLVSASQNPLVVFNQEGPVTASVTVTDANGCVDSSEAVVEVIFINDAIDETLEYCNDSTVVFLNADGFDPTATYAWTSNPPDPNLEAGNPNPGVSPDVPTVYSVTISQGALCSVTYTVTLVPLPGPDVTLPPDMVVCSDSAITLVATGTGFTYEWSNNITFSPVLSNTDTLQIQPVPNGVYFIKTTGLNGCYAIDSIKVNNGQVQIVPGPAEHIICAGESVELFVTNLNPNANLNYAWTPNLPNSPSQTVTPGTATSYQVVVTDPLTGCSETAEFLVSVITVGVDAEITGQDTIYPGESTGLLATPSGNGIVVSYEWSPSDGLNNPNIPDPTAMPEQDQTYTVTVTTENGCTATDEVTVYFRGGQCEEPYIFVPKAFTPNNDSNNDFFIVRGVNITELEFTVWDRWGEKVYSTTDLTAQGWDGTYKGKELTPDSYAWYVRARCGNGAIYEKKGDVTLLK